MSSAITIGAYLLAFAAALAALFWFIALLAEIDLEDGRAPFESAASERTQRSSGKAARGRESYDAAQAEMRALLARRRMP